MKHLRLISLLVLLFAYCLLSAQATSANTGYASFYHDWFEGKRTSSGQLLHQKNFTCAHRTLPFGTKLKVTNLENNKTAIVTVIDRGPFVTGRIIDVTKAVAQKLDFVAAGQTKVSIEIISSEGKTDSTYITTDTLQPFYKMEAMHEGINGYSVKVGSYFSETRCMELVRLLKEKYDVEAFVQTTEKNKQPLYRLFAGNFKMRKGAEELQEKLKEEFADCYVVELMKANK